MRRAWGTAAASVLVYFVNQYIHNYIYLAGRTVLNTFHYGIGHDCTLSKDADCAAVTYGKKIYSVDSMCAKVHGECFRENLRYNSSRVPSSLPGHGYIARGPFLSKATTMCSMSY